MRGRLGVAVLATAYAVSAGCGFSPPDPESAQIREEREAAAQATEALGPAAWGLGEPLGAAVKDVCQQGQRNWKVKEIRFACTFGRSWVTPGVDRPAEVAAALDDLVARVEDAGCTGTHNGSLDQAIRYWEDGTQREPGSLPGGRYDCDGVELELTPVSPADGYVTPIAVVGRLTGADVATPTLEEFPDDLERTVAASDQAMLWQVTATTTYAEVE